MSKQRIGGAWTRACAGTAASAGIALACVAGLPGCKGDGGGLATYGVHTPRGDESAAVFRIETEWVPGARLVKEDMTPRWQLGRYAFVPGNDNLLVVSRVMSAPARTPEGKVDPHQPRRDSKLERVWLVVPAGAPTGVPLKLEQMERAFMTGYDLGEIDDTQFVQPNRLVGQLTILEYGAEKMTALFDIDVRPSSNLMTAWTWSAMVEVPVVPEGRRAKKPEMGRTHQAVSNRPSALPGVSPTGTPSGGAAAAGTSGSPTTAGTAPSGSGSDAGSTTATATTPAAAGTSAPAGGSTAAAKSIVGHWSASTERMLYQMSFDPSGTFSYATVRQDRRGSPPSLVGGEWQMKGEYVVLSFQQQATNTRTDQPTAFRRRFEALRVGWNGERLVLTGQITAEDGPMKLELQPATPVAREEAAKPTDPTATPAP